MPTNLPRFDVPHALGRALQIYRQRHAAEVRDMFINEGLRPTAIYCAWRRQQIALGLFFGGKQEVEMAVGDVIRAS